MSSKYLHSRLKYLRDRSASDPQYIFQALHKIERNAVASTVHFTERKHFKLMLLWLSSKPGECDVYDNWQPNSCIL